MKPDLLLLTVGRPSPLSFPKSRAAQHTLGSSNHNDDNSRVLTGPSLVPGACKARIPPLALPIIPQRGHCQHARIADEDTHSEGRQRCK